MSSYLENARRQRQHDGEHSEKEKTDAAISIARWTYHCHLQWPGIVLFAACLEEYRNGQPRGTCTANATFFHSDAGNDFSLQITLRGSRTARVNRPVKRAGEILEARVGIEPIAVLKPRNLSICGQQRVARGGLAANPVHGVGLGDIFPPLPTSRSRCKSDRRRWWPSAPQKRRIRSFERPCFFCVVICPELGAQLAFGTTVCPAAGSSEVLPASSPGRMH